ncbi:HNH endonuclease [Secundilactobacillus pentosiphilus]|uniref:Putative HNH nuclease YajD n=2 Tax=Secundilactobacillus pentosiphilus TaxID=1714682 RepID=A0A1Z5IYT7_9LACO|nr:HNH endonuclease [Secundilactobacillus pentosiphilus]
MIQRRYQHDAKTEAFYHSSDWRSVRELVLRRDHFLCQECLRQGIVHTGNTVHHIVPLKDDWNKRLDLDNLETICLACHNKEHFEKGYSQEQKDTDRHAKMMGAVLFKRNPEL